MPPDKKERSLDCPYDDCRKTLTPAAEAAGICRACPATSQAPPHSGSMQVSPRLATATDGKRKKWPAISRY